MAEDRSDKQDSPPPGSGGLGILFAAAAFGLFVLLAVVAGVAVLLLR